MGEALVVRSRLGVGSALLLATRESVEEPLLLPPTRLWVGRVEVEGDRVGEPLPLPLPL